MKALATAFALRFAISSASVSAIVRLATVTTAL